MTTRVTFLGSGDAFASGGRFQACLHLEADGVEPLLLDCGATAVIALKRSGIDPASVGYVALSHLHGDHFAGLPWLILDGQFAKRTRPLTIAGPHGTTQRVNQAFEALYPGAPTADRPFGTHFLEFTAGVPFTLGPAEIIAYPVLHSPATNPHALKVQYAGKTIAYSGDTEWTDTLIEASSGADLFICECNFFATGAPGHLAYETLIEHRPELTAERIVITHMSDEMLEHLADVDLPAAADGAVIDL